MRVLPLLITAAICAACTPEAQTTDLANPAAEFCVAQGGSHTLPSSDGTGGTCSLPDGRTVDAREYFRAEGG